MTTNEILTLLSAGYTKDEITAMGGPAPLIPEPQPEPEPEPEPQPEPEQPDIAGVVNERLNKIEHSLSDLISAIQHSNIKHDSFEGNPENLEQKAISAMQGIIRPDVKERK